MLSLCAEVTLQHYYLSVSVEVLYIGGAAYFPQMLQHTNPHQVYVIGCKIILLENTAQLYKHLQNTIKVLLKIP